jgi:hypothetical protein
MVKSKTASEALEMRPPVTRYQIPVVFQTPPCQRARAHETGASLPRFLGLSLDASGLSAGPWPGGSSEIGMRLEIRPIAHTTPHVLRSKLRSNDAVPQAATNSTTLGRVAYSAPGRVVKLIISCAKPCVKGNLCLWISGCRPEQLRCVVGRKIEPDQC